MPPVSLTVESASGDTAIQAVPQSDGPYRVQYARIGPVILRPARYVIAPTGELLDFTPAEMEFVDYAERARQRIAELRNAPAPWAEATPVVSLGAERPVVSLEPVVVVVSADAEAAAIAIFRHFALEPPPSAVAIFPRQDGGLRLQTVGAERAVIVDISPTGNEFVGEYAGDDVYHTETMRNPADAARFITDSTR
ncbi:MAG TPA: hypothetical protein VMD08_17985 [Candidatus Baltobacteraceae bacterium]|nr:hypothetical protein [Candidatus Baltobacteraceae bacterium]